MNRGRTKTSLRVLCYNYPHIIFGRNMKGRRLVLSGYWVEGRYLIFTQRKIWVRFSLLKFLTHPKMNANSLTFRHLGHSLTQFISLWVSVWLTMCESESICIHFWTSQRLKEQVNKSTRPRFFFQSLHSLVNIQRTVYIDVANYQSNYQSNVYVGFGTCCYVTS